ncbi:MAG TPA: hypothetical protein VFJ58_02695 [Armatimonadota bacterium]|nr:hypothetical protein [Armatimonadota bacterium]
MSIQPSSTIAAAANCPKCGCAMIPLSQAHVGVDGKLAPQPDASGILAPLDNADPVDLVIGYRRDFILLDMIAGLIKFILVGIARVLFFIGAGAGAGAKKRKLSQTLRRYPRSLYCERCKSVQRRY